ncbi:MAG: ABC transporter substrate-binding protein, partial [Candidatus Hodarchaeota archaeon]
MRVKPNKTLPMFCFVFLVSICLFTTFTVMLTNASPEATKTSRSIVLQGITRHDGVIYNLYETEFKKLYPEVSDIQWLEISDPLQWPSAILSPSYSIDILWGGGPTVFNLVADQGLVLPIQNATLENYLKTNVPATFGGGAMMRKDSSDDILWVAAAISSFGYTINTANLATRGLPTPETWEDLASPEFFLGTTQHAVGMGEAPGTTSNTRVYQIILQAYGWEAGWDIITRMAGNSKIFPESGDTRDSVVVGEQSAAMTIDFYGYQAQAQNPDCNYIIPKGESIINGDPICVASSSSGDDRDYAEKFIQFVMSPEGQGLWLHPDINRLPMLEEGFDYPYGGTPRPDLEAGWNDAKEGGGIDFNETLAGEIYDSVIWYFHGTLTEVTEQLYTAWQTIVNAYEHQEISEEEYRSLSREMSDPSITLADAKRIEQEIMADPNVADTYVNTWKS